MSYWQTQMEEWMSQPEPEEGEELVQFLMPIDNTPIWPKTPGQEPAKLCTVEASAQMDSPFVLVKSGRIQGLTDEDLEGFDFNTGD